MSDSVRKQILAAFCTAIDTYATSIVTVVPATSDLNLLQYTAAQLPLAQVVLTSETPEYEKSSSSHALWKFQIRLTCYYLGAIEDEEVGEALVKELKDAIGLDGTLGGVCIDCNLDNLDTIGEFPLWRINLNFTASYERRVDNA